MINLIEFILTTLKNIVRRFLIIKYSMSDRIPWTIGYSEYKYDFLGKFINSPDLAMFKSGRLSNKFGYRMDERFVEYPWFFSRLKDSEIVILDAGSVLNFKQVLGANILKGRKIYITTLADEGRPNIQPSPSYLYEDLRSMCFKDDFFDAICSLSTVEHIGLDNTILYTKDNTKKENDKYAHLLAIKEYRRVLKHNGTLYLSLPFGIYKNHGWFQVFDSEMIDRVIDTFRPSKHTKTFFKYEKDQWNFSDENSCRDGYCFDIHASRKYENDYLSFSRCVICLEMNK